MPKRDFKGIWIPREVWTDEKMSWMEKLVFVEIDSLQDVERGGCYASNQYLSRFFNLSKSRISEIISSLCKKGKVRRYLVHHPLEGRMETQRLLKTDKLTIRNAERPHRKGGFTRSGKQNTRSEKGEYSIQENKQESPGRAPPGAKDRPGPKRVGVQDIQDPTLRKLFSDYQKKKEAGKSEEKKSP